MKISFSMFFLCVFTLAAESMYPQQAEVSLNLKNVTLRKAISEIEKESDYVFLIVDEAKNELDAKTSIQANKESINYILERIFSDTGLGYNVVERQVSVYKDDANKKAESKVATTTALAQQKKRVTGVVTDDYGETIIGANVMEKGTTNGTITDIDGRFTLSVADNATIKITYIGYLEQNISVKDKRELNIILSEDTQTLDEVVVTGYQTMSRERVTGSYVVVGGEKLEQKLVTDFKSAIEGQLAGVVVDSKGNLEIRGSSTFNAEKAPLVVMDGFPIEGGIEDINPMNIESITVLKDAVAASIYGARAGNGVIVVTTKMGETGKPRISYSGFANMVAKPQLKYLNKASTSDFIDAELDLFYENPNGPSTMGTGNMSRVTYLMMQVRENNMSEANAMAEIDALRQVDGMKQIEDAFFKNKVVHQHNLGIVGGTKDYKYNIAVNYQDTKESLINNSNQRMIFDMKNEWKPFSFLTAGASANFTVNNTESSYMLVNSSTGPGYLGNYFGSLTAFSGNSMLRPYTNLWDDNGNPADIWGISQYKVNTYNNTPGMKRWDYHPMDDINDNRYDRNAFTARITAFLRAEIIDGLTAEVGGNWVRGNTQTKGVQSADAFLVRQAYNDATSRTNNANHYFPDGAVLNEYRDINESWTIRTQFNYAKDFQGLKHRLNVLAGNEVRRMTFDNNQMATRMGYNPVAGSFIPVNIKDYTGGLYNSDMLFNTFFNGITDGKLSYKDNRFVSWYGNASYEYDQRFILSGSVRLDLTNFFGTDKKYRYKPIWSVGGTYKLSNESFWNSDVFDKLYVRGSYGINGNISLNNGPFLILSVGNYNQSTGGVSYGVSSPANNQLRWEKVRTANIGADFALLDYRLSGSIDYYNKYSSDLLASDAIDPTSGYTSLVKNVGEMSNEGFELSLNLKVLAKGDFQWVVSPNVSYNFNKVRKYNVNRPYTGSYTQAQGIMEAGYPANSIWGFKFAGLNDKGQSQIYNSEDEVILIGDATTDDVHYQGTFRPKWDLALTNNFKYKEWDLSFMFIAKLGHKYRKDAFSGSNYQNRHVGERWKKPGDENHTIYPVLQSWNMDLFDFPFIDLLVGNASYAKLRDVTLSYDLSKWAQSFGLSRVQVYGQARNLFRITAKGVDIDPETAEVNMSAGTGATTDQGYTSLPLPKEFFVGLKVSF